MYSSKISYTEPSVSYFDGMLGDTGNTTTSGLASVLVGLALVAAVATSARGSQNTLERREYV
jgi:hypothetical protein